VKLRFSDRIYGNLLSVLGADATLVTE